MVIMARKWQNYNLNQSSVPSLKLSAPENVDKTYLSSTSGRLKEIMYSLTMGGTKQAHNKCTIYHTATSQETWQRKPEGSKQGCILAGFLENFSEL